MASCGGGQMNQLSSHGVGQEPHGGQAVLVAGEPLERARAAIVMVHGRGATAESILELAFELKQPGFVYLAPQAAQNTWCPQSFLAPISSNDPWLSSALTLLGTVVQRIVEGGIPPDRTMLLGFSQDACLALESTRRHSR